MLLVSLISITTSVENTVHLSLFHWGTYILSVACEICGDVCGIKYKKRKPTDRRMNVGEE